MISEDSGIGELPHPRLEFLEAEVIWHVCHEIARTVEDVLSRGARALLLDARTSMADAPVVAELMAYELGKDSALAAQEVREYCTLAAGYLLPD